MMEDWQSFAFSWTETNSTKIEVAAFEMYLTTKLMNKYFFLVLYPGTVKNMLPCVRRNSLLITSSM